VLRNDQVFSIVGKLFCIELVYLFENFHPLSYGCWRFIRVKDYNAIIFFADYEDVVEQLTYTFFETRALEVHHVDQRSAGFGSLPRDGHQLA